MQFDILWLYFPVKNLNDMTVMVQKELCEVPPEVPVEISGAEALDIPVDWMGMRSIDIDLFCHGKRHVIFLLGKLSYLFFIPGVLGTELIAGEAQNRQAFIFVVIPQPFQPAELVCKTSKRSCIDDEKHLVPELFKGGFPAVDHGELDIVEFHDAS